MDLFFTAHVLRGNGRQAAVSQHRGNGFLNPRNGRTPVVPAGIAIRLPKDHRRVRLKKQHIPVRAQAEINSGIIEA